MAARALLLPTALTAHGLRRADVYVPVPKWRGKPEPLPFCPGHPVSCSLIEQAAQDRFCHRLPERGQPSQAGHDLRVQDFLAIRVDRVASTTCRLPWAHPHRCSDGSTLLSGRCGRADRAPPGDRGACVACHRSGFAATGERKSEAFPKRRVGKRRRVHRIRLEAWTGPCRIAYGEMRPRKLPGSGQTDCSRMSERASSTRSQTFQRSTPTTRCVSSR